MRHEQFGGDTVYRVYERERLRRMARKLGLRLLKFRDPGPTEGNMSGGRKPRKFCPVLMNDARKRTASE
jgi:hypothetical protein